MKKILLFLLLILSWNGLNAEEWTDELYNDNKYIIESEVRYKFYKIGFLESIYEIINEKNIDEYDLNDYQYTEYSDWNTEYPSYNYNRIIENQTREITFDTNKFNYITISNFITNSNVRLYSIEVKTKNNDLIPYNISIRRLNDIVTEEERESINNNKFATKGVKIDVGSFVSLKLDEYYNTNDITIKIIFQSDSNLRKNMQISFTNDEIYFTKFKTYETSEWCVNYYCNFNVIEDNTFQTRSKFNVMMYRYKDTLYRKDIYGKKYENGYYTDLEGYLKDVETAKVFYRYQENTPIIQKEYIGYNEPIKTEIIDEIEEQKEPIGVIKENSKIALNNRIKVKTDYNYYLIFGSIFVITGFTLLVLILLFKKIKEKCRMK